MHLLATLALDLLLALTFLISLQIAAGWGELCGIRPGRDKSGLGGFAMLFLLFGFRWLALAACLLYAPPLGEVVWTLVVHAALGLASAQIFSRGVARVQKDGTVTNAVGLFGSSLLPAPAWAFAVHGVNIGWLGTSNFALMSVGVAAALLHVALHEQRRRSLLAPRPAPVPRPDGHASGPGSSSSPADPATRVR